MRFLLLLAAAFSVALAEDFDPALAPAAQKYRADAAALRTQREAAIERARQVYFREIDTTEKLATTSGDLKTVAVLGREREVATSGVAMPPAFPPELPTRLLPARKAFQEAFSRVTAEFLPRFQRLDADYLRVLATLQPKAAGNDQLADQLNAEKQLLLTNATTGSVAARPAGRANNTLVNGDFAVADSKGAPSGWKEAYPGAGSLRVVPDGAGACLRVEIVGQPSHAGAAQDIAIPQGARQAIIRGRMRGKATNPKPKDPAIPAPAAQVLFWPRDAQGANLEAIFLISPQSAGWKTEQKTVDLPPQARTVQIQARCVYAAGAFDFDDISVEFK